MADVEALQKCILRLYRDADSKDVRTAIETLITIYRNILHEKETVQFRRIKLSNPQFKKKVWDFYGARQFMLIGGWIEDKNEVFFWDDACVQDSIKLLLDNRNVTPSENEWTEDGKYEGQSELQLREEELKKKAVKEREKELQEYMKDKREREDIAKSIKAEHRADLNRRRYFKPQVGNQLTNGARVQNLNSSSNSSNN